MGKFRKYNRDDFEKKGEQSFGRKFGGRESERGRKFGRRDSDKPRGSFSGRDSDRPRFGGREKPELEMFDVICDRCGKECKVPFKPTRGKPVYCSECFSKNSGSKGGSGELEEINRKLDKIMQALRID